MARRDLDRAREQRRDEVQRRLAKAAKPNLIPPDPPPRYDAVFDQGLRCLNADASAPLPQRIHEVISGARPWALVEGDCLDVLRTMPDASCDALVCDPPAGISFMGKTWDRPGVLGVSGGVAMPQTTSNRNPSCRQCGGRKRAGSATKGCECETPDWNDVEYRLRDREAFIDFIRAVMAECLRVLKPGAHGLVWAIPRTSHWTATALEDAGFEVRDVVTHLFGSGFPKSLDVSKAIDKAAGAERDVVGSRPIAYPDSPSGYTSVSCNATTRGSGIWKTATDGETSHGRPVTAPATPEAARWSGWGTALKPAAENWILVRKPLVGTVAANVLAHGTGALNIDGCRVAGTPEATRFDPSKHTHDGWRMNATGAETAERARSISGRWPANLVLSHTPECRCVGTKRVKGSLLDHDCHGVAFCGADGPVTHKTGHTDADGKETVEAWECAPDCPVRLLDEQSGKLTSGSRAAGVRSGIGYGGVLEGDGGPAIQGDAGGASRFFYTSKASSAERNIGMRRGTRNTHPTVKPAALMEWLCRLVTPPGGIVLDPFAGSGSTLLAALRGQFRAIGIEREREYVEIARDRIVGDAPLLNMVRT